MQMHCSSIHPRLLYICFVCAQYRRPLYTPTCNLYCVFDIEDRYRNYFPTISHVTLANLHLLMLRCWRTHSSHEFCDSRRECYKSICEIYVETIRQTLLKDIIICVAVGLLVATLPCVIIDPRSTGNRNGGREPGSTCTWNFRWNICKISTVFEYFWIKQQGGINVNTVRRQSE